MVSTKARVIKRAIFTAADEPTMTTALDAWFLEAGERVIIEFTLAGSGGSFMAIILYTEG